MDNSPLSAGPLTHSIYLNGRSPYGADSEYPGLEAEDGMSEAGRSTPATSRF